MQNYFTRYTRLFRTYTPVTPGIRTTCLINKSYLWRGTPCAGLTVGFPSVHRKKGKIIFRTYGNGNKQAYRRIDYIRRRNAGVPCSVIRIEYDPNRSCFIALLLAKNNILSYITCGYNMSVGDRVTTHTNLIDFTVIGRYDTGMLRFLPEGITLYNIEVWPGQGAKLLRSAGKHCLLIRKLYAVNKAWIRFIGGRNFMVSLDCIATMGVVSNRNWRYVVLGKAGRSHWLGRRPIVRGVARNPVDHPHGGGNGKKSKRAVPRTFWGKLLKWRKTSRSVTAIKVKQ